MADQTIIVKDPMALLKQFEAAGFKVTYNTTTPSPTLTSTPTSPPTPGSTQYISTTGEKVTVKEITPLGGVVIETAKGTETVPPSILTTNPPVLSSGYHTYAPLKEPIGKFTGVIYTTEVPPFEGAKKDVVYISSTVPAAEQEKILKEGIKIETPSIPKSEETKYYIEQNGVKIPISKGVYEKIKEDEAIATAAKMQRIFITPESYVPSKQYGASPITSSYMPTHVLKLPSMEGITQFQKEIWNVLKPVPLEQEQRYLKSIGIEPSPLTNIGYAARELTKGIIVGIATAVPSTLAFATEAFIATPIEMIATGDITLPAKKIITGLTAFGASISEQPAYTGGTIIGSILFWKGASEAWKKITKPETIEITKEPAKYQEQYGWEERIKTEVKSFKEESKYFGKGIKTTTIEQEKILGKPTTEPRTIEEFNIARERTTIEALKGYRKITREVFVETPTGPEKLPQEIVFERYTPLSEGVGKIKTMRITPEEWTKIVESTPGEISKEIFERTIAIERPKEFLPFMVKSQKGSVMKEWPTSIELPSKPPTLFEYLGIRDLTQTTPVILIGAEGKITLTTEATLLAETPSVIHPVPMGIEQVSPAITESYVIPKGAPNIFKAVSTTEIFGVSTIEERITPSIVKIPEQAHWSKVGTITEKEANQVVSIKPTLIEPQKVEQIVQPSITQVQNITQEEYTQVVPIGITIQAPIEAEREMISSKEIMKIIPKTFTKVVEIPEFTEVTLKKVKEIPKEWPIPQIPRMESQRKRSEIMLGRPSLYRKRMYPTIESLKEVWGPKKGKKMFGV